MPEPTKPAPGADTGDKPAAPSPPADAAKGAAGQAPDGNPSELARLLAEERTARQAADKSYAELRRAWNQRDAEIRDLRSRAGDNTNWTPPTVVRPSTSTGLSPVEREDLDMVKFKQNHEDWREYWPEVQKIIDDPVRVRDVAVVGPDGQVDTYRSVKEAYLVAKIASLEAARNAAEAKKQELQAERDKLNSKAVVSGVSGSATDQDFSMEDIEKMSLEDLRKHLEIDASDPPSWARRR